MIAAAEQGREFAAIDIGSNSVRLVIYRLEGRAIWTVFNEKVLAGLGRDLATTGKLSVEGVAVAMTALKRFTAVLEGVRPARAFVAATAAVREAEDGGLFCERVAAETGLHVRVLSGEEEARYAALGVLAGIPDADGVVGDLGGSSLELTRVGSGQVGQGVTLALGPFALTDSRGFDAGKLRDTVAKRLKPVGGYAADTLYAVGGAWRTLAQVQMSLSGYPLHIVHQYAMSATDAREAARLIARQSRASLEKIPGLSKKRAEALPYAALVMEGVIERLKLKRVVTSAWGVREGQILEAMEPEVAAVDPLIAGASALGVRQGVAPGLARALVGWIQPVMGAAAPGGLSPERDQVMIEAACRLADLGARLHPDHRLELVFDQVLRAPVPGQTHVERAYLAMALNARYGGGEATPEPDTIARLLSDEDQARARVLGLAIRLGCDMSGRSPQLLANATAKADKAMLTLTATPDYADVLLGEQTRKRARALAEAMRLKLEM